jgi:hypothetical protein
MGSVCAWMDSMAVECATSFVFVVSLRRIRSFRSLRASFSSSDSQAFSWGVDVHNEDQNFLRFSRVFGEKNYETISPYLGSFVLCKKLSAIFDSFRRKNWRFSQKPML